MKLIAYYNEIDTFCCAWLSNLMDAGVITPGYIDNRSIEDVTPDDVSGYTRVGFFAGIGVWDYALRLAGWPEDRPVWHGSCPCQPFSSAGKQKGFEDERHLWPEFFRLVRSCHPSVVFGEQVASKLVTGKFSGHGMLSVWETRQFLDLRKDWLQGHSSQLMQRVSEPICADTRCGTQDEYRVQSESSCCSSQESGQGTRIALRFGSSLGLGTIGSRTLPTERSSIRHDGKTQHGYPISGQERPNGWLHKREHESDFIWPERSLGGLGRTETFRSGDSGDEATVERINDLIAEVSCEVEAEDGASWLDSLYLDLGRDGYTCGSCVTPAASFGAPHNRQRLYWVGADTLGNATSTRLERATGQIVQGRSYGLADDGAIDRLANSKSAGSSHGRTWTVFPVIGFNGGKTCRLANTKSTRRWILNAENLWATDAQVDTFTNASDSPDDEQQRFASEHPGPVNGHWRDADWLLCRDGKWRAVESSTFEMADGLADRLGYLRIGDRWSLNPLKEKAENRVGRLRGYGNAINAEQAKAFIEAYMEVTE